MYNTVKTIRGALIELLIKREFIRDKSGVRTVELLNASFVADEPSIIGEVNHDYVNRELEWYLSQSRNVNDIPPPVPAIWKAVATPDGLINSNYGWCIFSSENGLQYNHCLRALISDRNTRRAMMIYTRPSMQTDYNAGGMSDFMCTNSVQYVIRGHALHAIVNMRSNDAWAGYRNDYAWQSFVLDNLVTDYNLATDKDIRRGQIFWNVGSLHVYEKQFYLLVNRWLTGKNHISLADWKNDRAGQRALEKILSDE